MSRGPAAVPELEAQTPPSLVDDTGEDRAAHSACEDPSGRSQDGSCPRRALSAAVSGAPTWAQLLDVDEPPRGGELAARCPSVVREHAGVVEERSGGSAAEVRITGEGTLSARTTRSTTWWIVWANAGVEALRRSVAARTERRSGAHWYPSWRYEMEDGLVAVSSMAFAIEAITRQLTGVEAVVEAQTRERWRAQDKGAAWRTREVLKRCVRGGEGQDLDDRWRPVIDSRNAVVHFQAELRPSVPYNGMNVAVEDAEFTADKATEAVELLFATLDALGTRYKPAAAGQAEGFAGQLELLRARRRDGGVPLS